MKIKKGDQVKIISGNDKGKQGKVFSVLPHQARIVVEGLNMKKKHLKPRQQGKKGELVKLPASMAIARVMLLCPHCSKATRIGLRINESDKKLRICKKCGGEV